MGNKRMTATEKKKAFEASLKERQAQQNEENEKNITRTTKDDEENSSLPISNKIPSKESLNKLLGASETVLTKGSVGGKTASDIKRDSFRQFICFKENYQGEDYRSAKVLDGVLKLYEEYKAIVSSEMNIKGLTLLEITNEALIRYFNDILEPHPDFIQAREDYRKKLKKKDPKKFK